MSSTDSDSYEVLVGLERRHDLVLKTWEAINSERELDGDAAPRQVYDCTLVATMNAERRSVTERTPGVHCYSPD